MKIVVTRPVYWLLGWLSASVGIVGIFVPLLPTTVFFIMAAWCWSRSHPHLAEKIFQHPRFGRGVKGFIEHGQVSVRGKCFATAGIVTGFLVFLFTARPSWMVSVIVAVVFGLIVVWLITRPTPIQRVSKP